MSNIEEIMLQDLADEYGLPLFYVEAIYDMLGDDYDGFICALEDAEYMQMCGVDCE